MRTIRGLVAALLVGLGVIAFAPTPAYACSCATGSPEQFMQWADAVFTGTVEDKHGPQPAAIMSSMDPVTYVVHVDRVYKGEAAPVTEVLSAASGASCGLENIRIGERYVVFASFNNVMGDPTEELWANLCGGTAPAGAAFVGDVEAVAGSGSAVPPPEEPASHEGASEPPVQGPVAGPDAAADDLAAPFALASGGALVVLTGLLWLRFWRH